MKREIHDLSALNAELLTMSAESLTPREYDRLKRQMVQTFDRVDDVYELAKQWLRMSGLVYMAVDRETAEIRYVFGRWDQIGYAAHQMVGRHLSEFVHPDDWERTGREVERRAESYTERGVVFVNRYRCNGGGWATVEWFGEGGDMVGGLVVGAGRIVLECGRDDE